MRTSEHKFAILHTCNTETTHGNKTSALEDTTQLFVVHVLQVSNMCYALVRWR